MLTLKLGAVKVGEFPRLSDCVDFLWSKGYVLVMPTLDRSYITASPGPERVDFFAVKGVEQQAGEKGGKAAGIDELDELVSDW